ncbi:Sensor protein ZraS [Anatilimnocola aggregata]|uniref:histidine kinase n=1 Tax=Anatilimnocola aggregata TaxID=2528021 RepID=A0A517Y672_9BACT|nr:ATP-binding protein [Anatilimnocola aggregata]QDU25734.1 Sensor protein ZraS [Anatilimnocola aggregata]
MATLFVMQGRDRGKRYELRPGYPQTLGRDESNRIQLADNEVSRRHAEVRDSLTSEGEPGGYCVVDLQSSNGTYVNDQRIGEHYLRTGDRLLIGRTLLLFTETASAAFEHLSNPVDIIGTKRMAAESRIVKSMSREQGSMLLAPPSSSDSPWLARARSNLQIMYRTALAVSHTLDIDQLLQRILELIFEWVEADRGCIMIVDQETGELTPTSSRNRQGEKSDERLTVSRTILDYVVQNKEGVLTSDAREDERWDHAASIVQAGVREAICVPLQGRYGTVGVIYIDTYTPPAKLLTQKSPNRFTEEHLKLMVAIGHQAALAVEDTSYYSAMVQAERLAAVGQTIATLSHHIKNILQGIRGGSYLIEEGLKVGENDVVRRGWRIVEKNQERISNLVMDMLTFSKEREPDLQRADMNETIADVVELMQTRAQEAGVLLQFSPSADVPMLLFDADLMHRAILNIVTNAIDACEKREAARVTLRIDYNQTEKTTDIVVEDNGEGIAPEDIQKIFSVFESRKGARGTGLGLPVSQKILREHGGEIIVSSIPGTGSKFVLTLPAKLASQPVTSETLRG